MLFIVYSTAALASEKVATMLVEKQHFSTENFITVSGKTIAQVDIGWESYGTLNEEKDNVISETSKPEDKLISDPTNNKVENTSKNIES